MWSPCRDCIYSWLRSNHNVNKKTSRCGLSDPIVFWQQCIVRIFKPCINVCFFPTQIKYPDHMLMPGVNGGLCQMPTSVTCLCVLPYTNHTFKEQKTLLYCVYVSCSQPTQLSVTMQDRLKQLINTGALTRSACVFKHLRVILQSPAYFITLHAFCAAWTFFKMAFSPSIPFCTGVKASDIHLPCVVQGGKAKAIHFSFVRCSMKAQYSGCHLWICILLHHASTCPRRSLS